MSQAQRETIIQPEIDKRSTKKNLDISIHFLDCKTLNYLVGISFSNISRWHSGMLNTCCGRLSFLEEGCNSQCVF